MHKGLRVLHLEDDSDYVELVRTMLEGDGLRTSTVSASDLASFVEHLERERFDIILADWSLPTCTGTQALEAAKQKCPDTPFLMVSGTIGEQTALESLKRGATDYVMKQWPERLVPAVRRAVLGAREHAQRKRAESELVHRERYFRALTENSLDVLSIVSRDGLFQYNSPSMKRVLGYEPEELAGHDAFQLVHPDDLPGAMGAFERVLNDPQLQITQELRCRRRDGSWCYLEVVGKNRLDDPEIAGVVMNSRDVTERKQAEGRLRVQSAALESTDNAIVITDRAGRVIWANPAFTRLSGYSSAEVVGQNPRLLKSGHHDEGFYRNLWETIVAGRVWHAEMVNRRKDGSLYTEEMTITPVRDQRGEITHFVAVKQDVTERKLAERALLESQQRFSVFMDHMPVAVSIKDGEGRLLFANKYLQDVFGWKQWEGRTTAELFPPDIVQRIAENDRKALAEGLQVVSEQIADGAGRVRSFEIYKFRLAVEGKPALLGSVAVDTTERRELESQLRQLQKMEAIGLLAGGVAHDFNNLLLVMRGSAEILLMEADKYPEEAKECLGQITAAAERAANLTRQLLAFSRKQVMQSKRLALEDVIMNLTKMLKRIIGEHIDLQCHYGSHLPTVQADAGMLEQVLVNLVVNARDAMPRGGELHIGTGKVTVDQVAVQANAQARAGEFVCLTVRDTGIGMTEEQLPRIFEPFYTTKAPGKGTGLGLATVYGIVQQHQGWIEVSSAPERGAMFKIFLPALPDEAAPSEAPEPAAPLPTGTETILLVEDEAPVRRVTRRMLEAGGYKVYEAASGPEAIQVWTAHAKEIALVLTDIVMPEGMTGRELATFMYGENPGVKIIFMSGYSADIAGKDTQIFCKNSAQFLQKPCSSRVLLESVRRTLDGS